MPISKLSLMRSFLNMFESLLMRKKTKKQIALEMEVVREKEAARLLAARLEGKELPTSGSMAMNSAVKKYTAMNSITATASQQ